eukprot:4706336-Amphidinium_carterae.1
MLLSSQQQRKEEGQHKAFARSASYIVAQREDSRNDTPQLLSSAVSDRLRQLGNWGGPAVAPVVMRVGLSTGGGAYHHIH